MKISPIDSTPDLFKVDEILPWDLIRQIEKEDLWSYPWEFQNMQNSWKRRKLIIQNTLLAQVDYYYNQVLDLIAEETKIIWENKHCNSSFWLDYEGFDCAVHLDGEERNFTPLMAMQVFLSESESNLGTVFYHDEQGKNIRYECPYKINTGYLQFNHARQWHGMPNRILPGELRLSSYTYFGQFKHK